ncbi:hypothetical protein FBEOM_3902 [Fusarium beomiforme]|uniref:Uncharacterized protein n=1 Tax=Fusarium beomiforme TaxID=44412 RepID=A0A9P5AP90_9HYPO|nr:hypothetical protein FBEOM_3902 [Fusarium beomiforme]
MEGESISKILLQIPMCEEHRPLHPNTPKLRPRFPILPHELEPILEELRCRHDFSHIGWKKCLEKLEKLKEYPEQSLFDVLNILENAFFDQAYDLDAIADLKRDAEQDASVLLYPALEVRV